jgi:hypothetical protein
MAPHLLAFVLAGAPSIAIPGLNGVRLAPGEAELYADVLSGKLVAGGLKVFTSRDVQQLIGLERQQQLLGCAEGSSCITEMIGALGVDAILVGDIGALGDEFILNFKILSARNGQSIALYNARAANVKAMPDALALAANALLHQLASSLAHPELEPKALPEAPTADHRAWAVLPAAVGVAAAVTGAVLEVQAHGALDDLRAATTPQAATAAAQRGSTLQTTGYVLVGVGAACLVTAAVIALFGKGEPRATAGVVLTPAGATFAIGGTLP